MKLRLLWKLIIFNGIPVVVVTILVVWLAVDNLASSYFMNLMDKYNISPVDANRMFLDSIHRYLLWATIVALVLAALLSYLLTRVILTPLSQMTAISHEFASGRFITRVETASRDEVGELATAFNRMADSLERLEGLRKTMVADLAHELRTPLTNLRGYMEALSDGVIPPQKETLKMLEQEILRLVHLVEDLQQLARADAARAYLKRSEIPIDELVQQVLGLFGPNFREKGVEVSTSFDNGRKSLNADREKILQALANLLDNALKYTPSGGRVSMTFATVEEGVKVTIANSGEGIAEKDLPFIFERFFRTDRSRSREAGGAGIGLAIVKELVEAHGGKVGAESGSGETRVWFTIPS